MNANQVNPVSRPNGTKAANPFQATRNAFTKGIDLATKSMGLSNDPDLSFYDQLQPQDFQNIEGKWGRQGLINYVKTMETKRMTKGG